jgi:hypothetical protein
MLWEAITASLSYTQTHTLISEYLLAETMLCDFRGGAEGENDRLSLPLAGRSLEASAELKPAFGL